MAREVRCHQTDRRTDTPTDYSNPRCVCAPRVNYWLKLCSVNVYVHVYIPSSLDSIAPSLSVGSRDEAIFSKTCDTSETRSKLLVKKTECDYLHINVLNAVQFLSVRGSKSGE